MWVCEGDCNVYVCVGFVMCGCVCEGGCNVWVCDVCVCVCCVCVTCVCVCALCVCKCVCGVCVMCVCVCVCVCVCGEVDRVEGSAHSLAQYPVEFTARIQDHVTGHVSYYCNPSLNFVTT